MSNLIIQNAPILNLHPEEDCFPLDPLHFIKNSRFRHHKTAQNDQGYNKVRNRWLTNNDHSPEYYDIPVRFINSYGIDAETGKNRRPRDGNCGSKWNVFLESRNNMKGTDNLNNIPVFYYKTNLKTNSNFYIKLLFPTEETVIKIQYWYFFGYNSIAFGNHQGDWEHVTLFFTFDGQLKQIYFKAHDSGVFHSVEECIFEDGRLNVFIAKGCHASYFKPGKFKGPVWNDYCENGGRKVYSMDNLKNLSTQPWKDFAGAWGAVGNFDFTTGPLGPYLKRHKL